MPGLSAVLGEGTFSERKQTGAKDKRPSSRERDSLFDALVEVTTGGEREVARGWVGKVAANLRAAGYGPALVRRAYRPGGWWYAERCKNMDRVPTPSLGGIEKTIGLAARYYRELGEPEGDTPGGKAPSTAGLGAGVYV